MSSNCNKVANLLFLYFLIIFFEQTLHILLNSQKIIFRFKKSFSSNSWSQSGKSVLSSTLLINVCFQQIARKIKTKKLCCCPKIDFPDSKKLMKYLGEEKKKRKKMRMKVRERERERVRGTVRKRE